MKKPWKTSPTVAPNAKPWQRFVLVATLVMAIAVFSNVYLTPAIARDLENQPKTHDQLTFPPLPEINLPEYERYTLPNGLVVYLMPDRRLPLVSGSVVMRAGSRWEPADQVGLAQLTGTTMRLGGTEQNSPAQLNNLLEQKAAAIETSIGTSSGSASFSSLSKDFDLVFDLFAQVLQTPAFDEAQIALAKNQLRGAIARRNDDPGDIASREFSKMLYGPTSPYARTVEYQTLANIDRQAIIDFHRRYVRPDQMILGIVGDFDSETIKQTIAERFGNWQGSGTVPQLTPPSASQVNDSEVFLVNLPHVTQSNVLLGQIGGMVDSPDYAALSVMNGVLGGFAGRLFNNIRSTQGLAYSVSGSWQAAYDYPGYFLAGGPTRTETTVQFLQSLLQEFEKLRITEVTAEELAYAKDSILNSFVFNFERPGQTLSRLMTYEYYGYPEDFIFTYQQAVMDTTVEDVQRVAAKYLQPEQMIAVIVGQGDRLKDELEALDRRVQMLEIAIPEASS
ncbi:MULTISPECIES: pitrilysin family protein [unclassified Synechocystis]|nr:MULTISPECIES: pitrilysin family protein [unclassified Synechocystis]UOO13175.1 insulinase family protein [Synechocystis sp. PCC 6803]